MQIFAMLPFCYMGPCFFALFNFFIFSTFLIFQHFSRTHKKRDSAVNIAKNCNMGLYKGSRLLEAEASALKFDAIQADYESSQGDYHAIKAMRSASVMIGGQGVAGYPDNEAQAVKA